MKTYYFDNAASSWPKPTEVIEEMMKCLQEFGASPGRGNHKMAVRASRAIFETRNNLAKLFNVNNPIDIIFTLNTTEALNLAIKGFLKTGDHVISTSIEHNSVRRPLEYLQQTRHTEITYVQSDQRGYMDLNAVRSAIRKNTKMLVCSHSSNLLGTIMPLADLSQICKDNNIVFLVDAAQTAGTVPIDVQSMGIDMLAFPGHKGLMGPQGTGGLYINPNIELEPLIHGGTGSQSENIHQPNVRPDRFESGTQNTVGIVGLNEGVKFVLRETVERIKQKEGELIQLLMAGLQEIEGLQILGPSLGQDRTGLIAFEWIKIEASELAYKLDELFGIAVRAGLHCTPLAHQSAGTLNTGAVRASVSYYTTRSDIEYFLEAISIINRI